MKKLLLTCAIVVLAPACARTQKLIINTSAPGAQVSVQKLGEVRMRGTIVGAIKVRGEEPFQDAPILVGTSPLTYEFPVVEDQGGWGFFGIVSTHQKRVCQQVVIRASGDGQFAEQIVPVRGDVADVYLQLSPAHAATSVQQPRG